FRRDYFEQAGGRPAVLTGVKPIPSAARAALHRRRRVVKHIAKPCKRNSAEKQRVAQQHQREKCRAAQDALGPLQHGRRQPVARQKRKHGESRLGEQQIERLQRALVEQLVVNRLGLPPKRRHRQQNDGRPNHGDLKTAPVQKSPHPNRQNRAQHARQHDKQCDEHQRRQIEMPGHSAQQTKRREQRRNQKNKRPRRQHRGFDEFPVENGPGRNRQRQQKRRLPVAEQIGVADDEVAQQQQ